jgi:hypothetical protein
LHALLFPVKSLLPLLFDKYGLDLIMRMNRYTDHNQWDNVVKKNIDLIVKKVEYMIPLYSEVKNDEDLCLSRSIVLKMPIKDGFKVIEKGVIVITFTPTFNYYFRVIDIKKLLNDFFVVLEPSWAGYCDAGILHWVRFNESSIVVQASEVKDRVFLNTIGKNLIPVDFGASDWVDFRVFHPIEGVVKVYDSVYVTSYRSGKRHHVYFRAIAAIGDPSYRGAIACGAWGQSKRDVLNLIKYYDIENNIDVYESLSQKDLNLLLNKAKVNVLFSKKEGSNRSVFEGFFSNVPALVLKNNIGMNKNYINENTGMLVDEESVAGKLIYFKNNWKDFNPRKWAMENISPLKTTFKLNSVLQKISQDENYSWTIDIVAKVNSPEVKYFNRSDKGIIPSFNNILNNYKM